MLCMPAKSMRLPLRDLILGLSQPPRYLRAVVGAATADGAVSPDVLCLFHIWIGL
jgi:hypothetical protein